MNTIIAAVDFSPATESVVAQAAKLARSPSGRIVLLHVTEPEAGVVDFAVISLSVAGINEEAVARGKKRLEDIAAQLGATGVATDVLQVIGSPGREIVDQAHKLSADYIVLGSHGHTTLYDLVVGSTANSVLKHARCPVLVVPASPTLPRTATEHVSPAATP
jgi:nucleotide-binding universal stress UspA family protein